MQGIRSLSPSSKLFRSRAIPGHTELRNCLFTGKEKAVKESPILEISGAVRFMRGVRGGEEQIEAGQEADSSAKADGSKNGRSKPHYGR